MVGVLTAAVLVVLLAGLVAWAMSVPQPRTATVRGLPAPDRAWQQQAVAAARWAAAHDEVDGETRVLLRRSCPGLDGRPEVLEERVFETFPSRDPMWESRFTEAMSGARFRCSYLNAEDEQGQLP
jgi:hypothetical protein